MGGAWLIAAIEPWPGWFSCQARVFVIAVADSTSAKHVGMGHGDFILGGDYFVSHGWRIGEILETPRETIVRMVRWAKGWPKILNSRGHDAKRSR